MILPKPGHDIADRSVHLVFECDVAIARLMRSAEAAGDFHAARSDDLALPPRKHMLDEANSGGAHATEYFGKRLTATWH